MEPESGEFAASALVRDKVRDGARGLGMMLLGSNPAEKRQARAAACRYILRIECDVMRVAPSVNVVLLSRRRSPTAPATALTGRGRTRGRRPLSAIRLDLGTNVGEQTQGPARASFCSCQRTRKSKVKILKVQSSKSGNQESVKRFQLTDKQIWLLASQSRRREKLFQF